MKKLLLFILFIQVSGWIYAQDHYRRFESIDVIQYIFNIKLNDTTDVIEATADVIFLVKKPFEKLELDLASLDPKGKGMKVISVKTGLGPAKFEHKNNVLTVDYKADTIGSSRIAECSIQYGGIPADGLVISKNKYGDRTFFGDNWPDRAKHWLPSVDHPSDKSPVIFVVEAPDHYQVISNGEMEKITKLGNGYNKTVWRENVPLSTKLMVIGVADFAIGNKTNYLEIPVSSWVFPQNKEKGFENYKYGTKALRYFSELIGPYSYEKLAHVQSKTRYGGMENASCIFYHENTAISDQSQERLFAHEVAHQWFGNSVTEQNWHHVWLSEGFATYLTHVYNQHFHGEETISEGLMRDRKRIIQYAHRNMVPIIDTTVTEYIRLLNTNSYQKASWILHMLREKLGEEIFFAGLKKYYLDFRNSTALTKDFQKVIEDISGKDLDLFFHQWLWNAGHPVLKMDWQQIDDRIEISVEQVQKHFTFEFPIELEIQYENGKKETLSMNVVDVHETLKTAVSGKIRKVIPDPKTKLLFELSS